MLIVILCASVNTWAYDFEVDGFCFNKLSESTCELAIPSGNGSLSHYTGNIVIPSHVTFRGVEYTVTSIGVCALSASVTNTGSISYNDKLLSVQLPPTIENIKERAFRGCNKLSSITIPSSVKKVGHVAFVGCTNLTEITLQEGDEPISFYCGNTSDRKVFSSCPLKKIFLGRNIDLDYRYYGESCAIYGPFSGQQALADVSISDNVTTIPQYLFCGTTNLTNITLGNSIISIGECAFKSCTKLESVVIGNSLESIGDQCFGNSSKSLKLYLFSNKLSNIGEKICPSTASIYVINKDIYNNLLANYSLFNMFDVQNANLEYSGKAYNIQVINNTEFQLSGVQALTGCGEYTSIDANLDVFEREIPISIPCDIKIYKACATIIANDCNRKYGALNPSFDFSIFGLKNGETASVLQVPPTVETTAQQLSAPGTYPIIPFGAEAQNYTFNYERGTLTITKADQTIEWEQQLGTVNVGNVIELTATSSAGLPIKYTSTDETIADIFTQGGKKFVEFLKPGNVSIRATQEGNENYNEADRVSKSVKVDLLVSGISLNQNAATLAEGNSLQLTATVSPANASNKTLTWESANPEIASVDANGKVTAIKQGSTIITVKSTDGSNITAQCELTVVKLVDGISINITTATLTEGQSLQLEAAVTPELATNKTIEWSSSNESVATVSSTGKVTAIAKGSAVITAKSTDGSNISAFCNVNVIKLVSGIVLSETEMTLNEGQSATLTASITPDLANNKTLAWASSNPAVATVNQDGKVTAVSKGTAIISAKSTDGSDISASCTVNVVKLVSGIVLSETEITLNEGATSQLSAIVSSEANNKTLLWASSNEAVATVSQDGLVTAFMKGSAVITAKATDGSNVSASCTVNVVKLVTGIVLNETELTINEGQSAQITATVTPELANNKSLIWSSSNEAVATVSQDGKVIAIARGTAIITAKSTDGSNVSASCNVTVIKLVSGIVLSETEMTLNEGTSAQLTAIVSSGANNPTLVWASSDEKIATVTQDGMVNAISKGSAIITAKATDGSNITASCRVNVIKLVDGIVLSKTEITLNEGESATLIAEVTPDLANNKTITWASSDDAVASVDENGVITAHLQGTTVITAKSTDGSNLSASCNVTVVKLVNSIFISNTQISMKIGEQYTLTAYALPSDATNPYLRWYSEDTNVATVEDGVVTAVNPGITSIYVESTDGSDIIEKCEVEVETPSGIDSISSENVKVYISNGIISIANVPVNQVVHIFLTDGTLLKSELSTGNNITFQPSANGVYLVAVGSKCYKVVVR